MDELRLPLGKACNKCGEWKLFEEFHFHPKPRDRRQPRCKICACAERKAWAQDHPEKIQAQGRRFMERYRSDPDVRAKSSQRARKSYLRNRDRHRETGKAYYKANAERLKPLRQKWQQENAELCKVYHYRWMSRKLENGGSFTLAEWEELCKQYNHKCVCCGASKKLTVDHVVPVSKGGRNEIQNIQPLCKSCNSRKKNNTIDYRD